MDERMMLDQLEEVAKDLNVEVRYETMRKESRFNPGGMCRVHGAPVIIINRKASPEDRLNVLASAIRRFDLDGVFLRPGLREFLEQAEPGPMWTEDEAKEANEADKEGGGTV